MKKALALYLASASAALAHSGHEEAVVSGEAHWLQSADHIAVVALAGLALGLLIAGVVKTFGVSKKSQEGGQP